LILEESIRQKEEGRKRKVEGTNGGVNFHLIEYEVANYGVNA